MGEVADNDATDKSKAVPDKDIELADTEIDLVDKEIDLKEIDLTDKEIKDKNTDIEAPKQDQNQNERPIKTSVALPEKNTDKKTERRPERRTDRRPEKRNERRPEKPEQRNRNRSRRPKQQTPPTPARPSPLERIQNIGDFFKRKKDDKKFFLKVGIGVGIVLLLLVIIIVVAATVPKGAADVVGKSVDGRNGTTTTTTTTTTAPIILEFDLPAYYRIQVDDSLTFMLGIDDVTQSHIVETSQNSRTIYYIVNFKQQRQVYVGMLRENDNVASIVKENTVLFCEDRGFDTAFDGSFLDSARMKASGLSVTAKMSGIDRSFRASQSANPLRLRGSLAKIFNSSCRGLLAEDKYKWEEAEQACDGSQFESTPLDPVCLGGTCPNYNPTQPLTTKQACKQFRTCNFIRGFCDNFWTDGDPYNGRPYCSCRQQLGDKIAQVTCPDPSFDDSDCETPRRRANDMSINNPCLCQYNIPRIHPYITAKRDVTWRTDVVTVTGPAPNFGSCGNC